MKITVLVRESTEDLEVRADITIECPERTPVKEIQRRAGNKLRWMISNLTDFSYKVDLDLGDYFNGE